MKIQSLTVSLVFLIIAAGAAITSKDTEEMKAYRDLTEFEESVIIDRGTEAPFSGDYVNEFSDGVYYCKQCGTPLYTSDSKFHSGCGWPSFDSEIVGAVERRADPDGNRMEIVCAACKGHLGHVFEGEGFTPADTRHCVNSVSLLFVPAERRERAVFAAGCFWGVESQFQQVEGVLETTAGYTGGELDDPTYQQVCMGGTGHAEAVEVIFDNSAVSFEELANDPSTVDRQGPDIGSQYRSAVFYINDSQRDTLDALISDLRDRGYNVVTQIESLRDFWPAEDYHQDYYTNNGIGSSCHYRVNRFGD